MLFAIPSKLTFLTVGNGVRALEIGNKSWSKLMKSGRRNRPIPMEANMKPSSYQPSKAKLEEEVDMPGWSSDQVRNAFMRQFVAKNS